MSIYALPFPVFKPAMRIITAITNSFPAMVTTSFDHSYITGIIVRLYIPLGYGMIQANQRTGTILVTGSNTFDIDIDTTFYDVFAVPITWPQDAQQAQVVPIGEINSILTAAVVNVLPY